jgi:hypothetical protein
MDSLSQVANTSASKESQLPKDAPISALFEGLLKRLEDVLLEDTWVSSDIKLAILLDQVLLDLQHWNRDIQNHKRNILEEIEHNSGELAMTIRIYLLGIACDFEQLQRFFTIAYDNQMLVFIRAPIAKQKPSRI